MGCRHMLIKQSFSSIRQPTNQRRDKCITWMVMTSAMPSFSYLPADVDAIFWRVKFDFKSTATLPNSSPGRVSSTNEDNAPPPPPGLLWCLFLNRSFANILAILDSFRGITFLLINFGWHAQLQVSLHLSQVILDPTQHSLLSLSVQVSGLGWVID